MAATGVLGAASGRARGSNFAMVSAASTTASPGPGSQSSTKQMVPAAATNIGITFDPYDYQPLPARMLTTGAAINFPSVANIVGEIFNCPVLIPTTQLDSAQISPHRNAPASGFPARASLGGAYVARWVWAKERGSAGRGTFEEEMRRLLGKRWVSSGGVPLRTNVNAPVKPPSSGSSTPYGTMGRSGFGTTVLAEEDEDALEELERLGAADNVAASNMAAAAAAGVGAGAFGAFGDSEGRVRTSTAGTSSSASGSLQPPSTTYTTPDLSGPSAENGNGTTAAGTSMSLTPVTALPTSEAEMQVGLGKVAEADVDAFMCYAAIVPEYCRLEGMLVRGLV